MKACWVLLLCNYNCFHFIICDSYIFVVDYLLNTGYSYSQQPNICKIVWSSLYSWTMYINQNKIWSCHLMLNSVVTRWHLGFHFLFLNSAILYSCIFGNNCLYLLQSPFNTCYPLIFCWIDLVCIYRYAYRYIVGFYPPFLYLGNEHVSWSACFLQMTCICHFIFISCPEPPLGRSGMGLIPVWSGGFLIIFPAL